MIRLRAKLNKVEFHRIRTNNWLTIPASVEPAGIQLTFEPTATKYSVPCDVVAEEEREVGGQKFHGETINNLAGIWSLIWSVKFLHLVVRNGSF
jgi:hypothetical protein